MHPPTVGYPHRNNTWDCTVVQQDIQPFTGLSSLILQLLWKVGTTMGNVIPSTKIELSIDQMSANWWMKVWYSNFRSVSIFSRNLFSSLVSFGMLCTVLTYHPSFQHNPDGEGAYGGWDRRPCIVEFYHAANTPIPYPILVWVLWHAQTLPDTSTWHVYKIYMSVEQYLGQGEILMCIYLLMSDSPSHLTHNFTFCRVQTRTFTCTFCDG